jgi:DNA-3-methyladenine glycosylase I
VAGYYCDRADEHPLHRDHHDREHGRPPADDGGLFERLVLEINQAGLSWLVVLKKRAGLRHAFHGYDLTRTAAMGEAEIRRLRAEPAIVRHEGKIRAVIENARRLLAIAERHGSVRAWLDHHHPRSERAWLSLLRHELVFVGPEITREYLTGIGYLPGAHRPDCPDFAAVQATCPPWLAATGQGASSSRQVAVIAQRTVKFDEKFLTNDM